MFRSLLRIAPLALLSLAACTGVVTSDPFPVSESDLDQQNGGFEPTAEAPYFADSRVEALDTFTPSFTDGAEMKSQVMSASVQGARSYHVALVWGHLPPARDAELTDPTPAVMNWDGTVSVDQGAVGLERTLRFDPAFGDKVLPRTSAQSIAFVSRTLPHVDGLLVRVVVPPNAPAVVHFRTKSLTQDIDLPSLTTKAGGVVRLDDGRNGLFWVGFQDEPSCAKGFVVGRWIKARPALGTFRGVASDESGAAIGWMRGIWGRSARLGQNLFFGKTIEKGGGFRGLLGGTYGAGEFSGRWGTVRPQDEGRLEGYYSDGYERDDGRGVFVGRWSEACAR
jgi:hypothetical protein